jgi:hypothetical protein
MKITSEQLAYWYLRLNGFLTTQNFIVHPDSGSEQRTDADMLGVRFPYRAELKPNSMVDDVPFTKVADKPFIVMAEVKKSVCNLNGPWKEPQQENLQRVLRAIGAIPEREIETAAEAIYTAGTFSNSAYHLSLACFGESENSDIKKNYPNVPQFLWDTVLAFIYKRFRAYPNQKASHGQWDDPGKNLWNSVREATDESAFKTSVRFSD